jgi:CRP/FNR family cyclic AMP-dependent transcriptional regulator
MKKLIAEKEDLIEMMKKLLIFQSLSDSAINELYNYCNFLEFEAGETIVTQDTLSPFLYGLLEGNVNISMKSQENKDVYVNKVGSGDIFGEAAIFLDMKRTASVIANENVKLASISREKLIAFVYKFPESGIKLLIFIIFSLLHKLKRSSIDLVFEKESTVSAYELEVLKKFFPPTIDEVIEH